MDFYRPPTTQGTIDALGAIYRALRAWKFYPKGHPNRRKSIMHAHSAMLELLDGHNLSLSCGRNNFSFPDGETLNDNTGLSNSLSYELFARRVQKITFLKDLYQEDLLALLRIVALSPETIHRSGGLDKIMVEHGSRSIWANEFDLSIIRDKRSEVESRGVKPQGFDEVDATGEDAFAFEPPPIKSDDIPPEHLLTALLGRLTTVQDDDTYIILVRQAITCCDSLKSAGEYLALFPLLELLANHYEDAARTQKMRDFCRFAIEQISVGNEFIRFVLGRMEQPDGLSKDALQSVIVTGGTTAVVLAVEQLGLTSSIAARKILSNILSDLGDEAVPPLLDMLGDRRWFIVRNIAAVLGAIASPDAVPGLSMCLKHEDNRVCKEAVRSLAKIGGREAESALIRVLQEENLALYPQVIASLGGMKSRKSLFELVKIVNARDMFLTTRALKTDALSAIAMIGDRQVTPTLLKLITSSHLLASGRWKQLKTAIAHCLGKLGDPQALPTLKHLSSAPDELGAACSEAVNIIEKTGGRNNGSP
ncbi:MAG: HEAT repeat domain-containing protein [Deltaproteobacteria bacterium]|nr:HEAT repeat domain-containing protein [Deltaproteobacteria bacterium]